MKDAEDAIDRLLTALNETEASAGLENRILRAVQDRALSTNAAARTAKPRRPIWLVQSVDAAAAWAPKSVWVGAAVVTALLLIATSQIAHRAKPHPAVLVQLAPAAPLSQPYARNDSGSFATDAAPTHGRAASPERDASAPTPRAARQPSHLPAEPAMTSPTSPSAAPQDPMEALAWSEMRAPSRPAPPMPLTAQEMLLQRVVHRGDPVELAELDPVARDAITAREKAEFQAFFKPTPPEPAPENH